MDGDDLMNNIYEIFNETSYQLDEEIKDLEKLLKFTLKIENLDNVEFNVIFVDSETIHNINKTYRNVALEDNKTIELDHILLGDIYICIDKAREQASEYNHSFKRELSFLTIHGLLHLLGYDHMEENEEKVMFQKQEEILSSFGINR